MLKHYFDLKLTLKSIILDLNPEFSFFEPLQNFSFPPKPLFCILDFQIPIVEKVPMDHTNHFDFR